jgi:two-component system phosphate regulon sensor histidine kinase PhoR
MASPRDLYSFRRMLIVMLATVVAPVVLLSVIGFIAVKNERGAIERDVNVTFRPRLQELARSIGSAPVDAGAPQRLADARWGSDGTHYRLEQANEASAAVVTERLPAPNDQWQIAVYDPFGRSIGSRLVRNRVLYVSLIMLFLAAVVTGVSITGRAYYISARLSRLQTDFVSNVSHELRTPLTSIRMFIDTLQMDRARDPAQVKECLDLLAAESERLSNMIERMLTWARMEAGRRLYTLGPVPAVQVVDGAVKAFRAQTLGKPYSLTVEVPAASPVLDADADALTEAVINLLSNAFKYSGDAKRIAVRLIPGPEWTAIEVEDNGIGIGPRDRKRIFDKFYRAEQLLSRKTEGTGLGLSMVRHIVEGHKGRIECESEPDRGSRFRILLRTAGMAATDPSKAVTTSIGPTPSADMPRNPGAA